MEEKEEHGEKYPHHFMGTMFEDQLVEASHYVF